MKKYLLFLPLFFISGTALASTLASQPIQGGVWTSSNVPACQVFVAQESGVPSAIQYKFGNGTATTTMVNIYSGTSTCVDGGSSVFPMSGTLIASGTTICSGACADTNTTTTFDVALPLVAGQTYTWVVDRVPRDTSLGMALQGTSTASGVEFPQQLQMTSSSQNIFRDRGEPNYAYFILSGNGTFGSPALYSARILYPQNSTTTFIHDFTHFTYTATNNDTSAHTFGFRIVYDTTSTFDATPVVVSKNIMYNYGVGITHYGNIPKPENLASSTTYYAKLCVSQDSGNFECDVPITFKTGVILTGNKINTEVAGWFGSSVVEGEIMYPTSTTDITSETGLVCGQEFYNPANWACWAGQRIILLWNELKDFAVGTFEMGFDFFRQIFPINILSQLSEDLNSVQYSTSTIQSITFTGQGTAYKRASGGYYSFTFLTSSTLQESETAVGWNWETIVVYLLWALIGIVIVGSAFALIKHAGHNSTPHA